jgi:hypothetical protein
MHIFKKEKQSIIKLNKQSINLTKKGNNSKMGNGIYFKIARWVDLDMLHIFAI